MLTKALTIDSYIEKTVHTLLSDGEEADWTTMVRGEIQKILQSECRAREISLALFADAESICECVTAAEMTAILRWCARARSLQALEDGFHPRPADFAEGAQGLYRILTTLTETDQRYRAKNARLSIRIPKNRRALCGAATSQHRKAVCRCTPTFRRCRFTQGHRWRCAGATLFCG